MPDLTRRAFITLFGVTATAKPVMGRTLPESGAQAEVYTVSAGILNAADHELADGYFNVGVGADPATIMVPPQSRGWLVLRELRGRKVSLLARVDA